jgi:hypothetical protein
MAHTATRSDLVRPYRAAPVAQHHRRHDHINAQMDIVNAVWGAPAGPPFCVLHNEPESAWLSLYRPIITAYVQGGDGVVMMPVLIDGGDHSWGHVVLLVFDHSTQVQHVFDSSSNDSHAAPTGLQQRVFQFLTTTVLVDGYSPAPLSSKAGVVSTQQNFEAPPEAIDYDTDGGTCSLMVLLVACVCRRFGLADPVAAGRQQLEGMS